MKTLAPILLAITCAGCLNARPVNQGQQSMASVNQIGSHQILYVHLFGDRRVAAVQLQITPTHTSWRDAASSSYVTIPTKEIVDIRIKEQFVRKRNGFGMGMLAGASMGVMFGLSSNGESTDKSTYAVLGGMGMGVVGGMVGQMTSNSRGGVKYRVIWSNPQIPTRRAVW